MSDLFIDVRPFTLAVRELGVRSWTAYLKLYRYVLFLRDFCYCVTLMLFSSRYRLMMTGRLCRLQDLRFVREVLGFALVRV